MSFYKSVFLPFLCFDLYNIIIIYVVSIIMRLVSPSPFSTAAAAMTAIAAALLPSLVSSQTVEDIIVNDPRLTTLTNLVVATPGLADTLRTLNDITIFAPTNRAFRKVPPDILESLTAEQISSILQYHVVPKGRYEAADITNGLVLDTALVEESIFFVVNATGVFVNGISPVTQPNMMAQNGVIHKIGNFPLLPNSILQALQQPPPPTPTMAPPPPTMAPPTPAPPTMAPSTSLPPPTSEPEVTLPVLGNIVEVALDLDGFSTLTDLVVLAKTRYCSGRIAARHGIGTDR